LNSKLEEKWFCKHSLSQSGLNFFLNIILIHRMNNMKINIILFQRSIGQYVCKPTYVLVLLKT
jgi:hypothetical protein